jgi:CubicO group peptidase (beta-lactamase class C family)
VPFTQLFPYNFGGAGDINSNIEDMAHWVRLQLGNGRFEGRDIVSPENLAFTRTPKVGINDKMAYALGWVITQTPNGTVVWHDGGTNGFGTYVGVQLDKHIGVILLSNESNAGFVDATGAWIFDRLLGNVDVDHMTEAVNRAKKKFADDNKMFAKPANSRPSPPLAPLSGIFANPSFGKASLKHESDALMDCPSRRGA